MLGAIDWGFRVILVTDALCSSADETHDAMMNVYMNRFGEQVETVTTATLLESWQGTRQRKVYDFEPLASRADPLAERNRQGRPIGKEWFDGFLEELTVSSAARRAFCGPRDRVCGKAAARPKKIASLWSR